MITELSVQNFKPWKDTGALHFAPLTGFFGANSSGKTSILQVLLMLKQTVEQPSDWNEPLYFGGEKSLVNLGSFDDVIYQHNSNLSLRVSVSWKLPEEMEIGRGLTFVTSIDKSSERPNLAAFYYGTDQPRWRLQRARAGYTFAFPDFESNKGFSTKSREPFRCYGVVEPDGAPDEHMKVFLARQDAFESLFKGIHYLGPLRAYPRLRYAWEGKHTKSVGQHGENMVSALMAARIQRYEIDEQLAKRLRLLGLIESYRLVPVSDTEKDYEFLVTMHKGSPEVRLTDVGFGVSQVLPVLILCYYAPEGSILILEQPEAHLHPKVQSELADVLIDVVKNRNIQIILESHSEHLLHRLTRRIAEEQLSPDDTALYSCQINEGISEIEQLKMDEYGNISNWPQNFFGDDTGDLFAKAKAEIKRRKANK